MWALLTEMSHSLEVLHDGQWVFVGVFSSKERATEMMGAIGDLSMKRVAPMVLDEICHGPWPADESVRAWVELSRKGFERMQEELFREEDARQRSLATDPEARRKISATR